MMPELIIGLALIAGSVAVLGSIVVTDVTDWRNRRHQARLRQVERGLAQAQKRLEALALQQAAWLEGRAHEARKALIRESFRVSQETHNTAGDEHRCQKHNNVLRRL